MSRTNDGNYGDCDESGTWISVPTPQTDRRQGGAMAQQVGGSTYGHWTVRALLS